MPRVACVVLLGLVLAVPGRASLYQPDDPMPFPASASGAIEALPFDEFKRRLIVVMNQANPAPPADGKVNVDRVRLVERAEKRKALPKPSLLDTVATATDQLQLREADFALNRLKPRDNPTRPDYLVSTTLAHIHAARGEWRTAMDKQVSAIIDSDMPAEVKGWSKPQRAWVAKIDADYLVPYLKIQAQEAEAKPRPVYEEEDVYPLFPVPVRNKPHAPVRFVNDKGEYEPGTIAEAENAKLPPDALAIIQQMMLWFPDDARLYWLLAELYAAEGELDSALKIFDECVDTGRRYAGRRILMEHRGAVMAAVEKKKRDHDERRRNAFPISLRMIAVYFGIVAVVGVWAAVRAVRRRRRA